MEKYGTQIWIRLPDKVVETLDAWAEAESRSRANYLSLLVQQAVAEKQAQQAEPQQQPATREKGKAK